MSIAPPHPQSVRPDQLDGDGAHVLGHPGGIEEGAPGHLLDALGAGAGETEGSCRDQAHMPGRIPIDEEAVVSARDPARQRYL
jgi:hypothetical protein